MASAGDILLKVFERLLLHSVPSGILDGVKSETTLVEDVEAQKDLPSIRVYGVDGREDSKPDRAESTMTLTFTVSIGIGSGIYGLVELVQKLINAIETDGITGKKDLSLGGTLVKPLGGIEWETVPNSQSLTAFVKVTFAPRFWARASRL